MAHLPRFHTVTLGCKLNQFDSAAIEGELARRGYRPESDPDRADVVVVNTCTVTGKADADARRLIRRIRRGNATCRLLVTGCYAERDAAAIAGIPGVDGVFGNSDKHRLRQVLDESGVTDLRPPVPSRHPDDRGCDASLDLPDAVHFGDRARAFLKIQEGCNLVCSYCIIPEVRGRSRSLPPSSVARAARSLFDAGYREVVLTGVNTGDYGKDLDPPRTLADLLRALLADCGPNRIRLNSLEPRTVTDEIVELFREHAGLAPHLQVPLQSGSDTILRRMRRNYRAATYLERVLRLRDRVPDIGLGADVIVGFPGETSALFEETFRFIADSPLNYLHVFSWSPRPGTPAAELDGRPDGTEVRERSARLRELAARLGRTFRDGMVGRTFDAVVLGARDADDRRVRALTGNFVEVLLPEGTSRAGDRIDVRVDRLTPDGETLATPVSGATACGEKENGPDRRLPSGAAIALFEREAR